MGRVARIVLARQWWKNFLFKTRMTDQQIMAPSPQQPLDGQGVQRIPGLGRINRINGQVNSTRTSKRKHLKIATVDVATLRGKEEDVVEVMRERKIDILGLCETRFKSKTDKKIDNDYRLPCSSSDNGREFSNQWRLEQACGHRMSWLPEHHWAPWYRKQKCRRR